MNSKTNIIMQYLIKFLRFYFKIYFSRIINVKKNLYVISSKKKSIDVIFQPTNLLKINIDMIFKISIIKANILILYTTIYY